MSVGAVARVATGKCLQMFIVDIGATNAKHHVIRTEVVEDEAIRANDLSKY